MNSALKNELRALMEKSGSACVSIYMPTHRGGPEVEQDPIRYTNLLREVEKELIAKEGMRATDARAMLEPAHALHKDAFFWRRQGDGLAIFAAPDVFYSYTLPLHFEESAIVGKRFHLTPLLPLFTEEGRFYVLALSQQDIRLLECSAFGVNEIDLKGVPKSIDEVTGDEEIIKQINFQGMVASGGRGAMLTYRHGIGAEDNKSSLFKFFRKVDEGLREYLRNEHSPLILAGVESVLPIYKDANTYTNLYEGHITGNPEGLNAEELQKEAYSIVKPFFQKARQEAADLFMNLVGTGRASNDLAEVVKSASFGRIQFLFVLEGVQQWGKYDPEINEVDLFETKTEDAEDLLDFAAIQTLLTGGQVFRVKPGEVPANGIAAAVFRY